MSKTIKTKQCSKCKCIKPISEFYRDRTAEDGLQRRCKVCQKAYNKSDIGSAARRKYQKSDKFKIVRKRHIQTDKGKTSRKRFLQSDKSKTWRRDYEKTKKRKSYRKKWSQSKTGKDHQKRADIKTRGKHPDRIKARGAINRAVKRGEVPRPNSLNCSCGNPAQEYHHPSYEPENWLDVVPKCVKCHKKLHR